MDIEQLKIVLETVKGVGDSTLTVVGLWLARDFVITLLGYGVAIFGIKKAAELLTQLVCKTAFHHRLMDEIGTSIYLNDEEQREIIELIRKGKAAK